MYENFYGLSGKPFQLSPDPTFYFGSKGHESAYSYLKYGVYQGEGFLVITGEVGAGKTTLVRALLEELDPKTIVAAQIVNTQLEADDLLRSVAKAFGIGVAHDDKANLLASIEAFLLTQFQQKKRALLIVDEAQNLNARSIEELRMLSNFQCGDRALLQSFLVGQPELRTLLRSPAMEQFRQRVIASYHLGPLDEAETRGYIEHRLNRVGWKGDPAFDSSAIHAVFNVTGGIPRRINAVCNRLLLAGFLSGEHAFTNAQVEAVAEEITGELGVHALATTGKEPEIAPQPSNLLGNANRLSTLSDRIDRVEKSVAEMLDLMRVLVDPEKARPEEEEAPEPEQRPPQVFRRRRKTGSNA